MVSEAYVHLSMINWSCIYVKVVVPFLRKYSCQICEKSHSIYLFCVGSLCSLTYVKDVVPFLRKHSYQKCGKISEIYIFKLVSSSKCQQWWGTSKSWFLSTIPMIYNFYWWKCSKCSLRRVFWPTGNIFQKVLLCY